MTPLRTIFVDYDARHEPKTDYYCCKCQRDLKPSQRRRYVHLVNNGYFALHPEDEALYEADEDDLGVWPVGLDCARQIGLEWTFEKESSQ